MIWLSFLSESLKNVYSKIFYRDLNEISSNLQELLFFILELNFNITSTEIRWSREIICFDLPGALNHPTSVDVILIFNSEMKNVNSCRFEEISTRSL